jgi:glycosyltransferase involved in cell wall biosynthesis
VAVLESGSSHFFAGWLFRLCRIPVITVLHNTIWPAGFPPKRPIQKLIRFLDSLFFRWGSFANIGVSPECCRQVAQLTNGHSGPNYEIRAQFIEERFKPIVAAPRFDGTRLNVMFIGRITREKGVFDILTIAEKLHRRYPNRVHWEICGTGPDLEELTRQMTQRALPNVTIHGWVSMETLQTIYDRSHFSIIPTTSGFAEGLAMTAAEAILAGRPIITNPTVPALEILQPAALVGKTDDPDSYVKVIEGILGDPGIYQQLVNQCDPLKSQFYDRNKGLTEVLSTVLKTVKL